MKESLKCDDPRRLLTEAGLYLWRQWRLYGLPAWQDAMNILQRARHDVEEEDEALFLETLEVFLKNPSADATATDQDLARRSHWRGWLGLALDRILVASDRFSVPYSIQDKCRRIAASLTTGLLSVIS
jgi:hypothetical protein